MHSPIHSACRCAWNDDDILDELAILRGNFDEHGGNGAAVTRGEIVCLADNESVALLFQTQFTFTIEDSDHTSKLVVSHTAE